MSFGSVARGYILGMKAYPEIKVTDEAKALHKSSLVADLHNDIMMYKASFGFNLNKAHSSSRYFNPLRPQTDIPRLKQGGVNALGLGMVVFPWTKKKTSKIRKLFKVLDAMDLAIAQSQGNLSLARTSEDFIKARQQNTTTLFPGLEGLHAIEEDVSVLKTLKKRGLCYVTLTHLKSNKAAVSNYDKKPKFKGLSDLGFKVLDDMQKLNLIVDLAHCSQDTLLQAADYVKEPVIVSHTNCHKLFPLWRNVEDSGIKAVAETEGVIGIMISPRFISKNYCAPLSQVIDHIIHVVDLVGAKHAAIGSDIDGLVPSPNGFRDTTDFPKITQLLLNRGLSNQEIKGILGENFLRVFKKIKKE
jgi:membrane dipeptidase